MKAIPQYSFRSALHRLQPGDHLAFFYTREKEWSDIVLPFLAMGLLNREKCICILDQGTPESLLSSLQNGNIHTQGRERTEQLTILQEAELFDEQSAFEPLAVLKHLHPLMEETRAKGYKGVRITAGFRNILQNNVDANLFLEFESLMQKEIKGPYSPIFLCQFHEKLPSALLKHALLSHPRIIKDRLFYDNLYYIPPRESLHIDRDRYEFLRWLHTMERERQTKKLLEKRGERFHVLAENAKDLIYRIRTQPEIAFEYVSPSATDITGYTPEEHYLDPQLGFKIVHPEDRPIIQSVYQNPDLLQEPLVLRWIRKDGQIIWTEQNNVLIKDKTGKTIAIEGIARDISKRKEGEDKTTALFQALENIPQAIMIISSTGVIYYINPHCSQLLSIPVEELLEKTPAILAPDENDESCQAWLHSLHQKTHWQGTISVQNGHGKEQRLVATVEPVRGTGDCIIYFSQES